MGTHYLPLSAQQDFFFEIVTNNVKIFRGIGLGIAVATDVAIVGAMFWYMQPSRNPGMAKPEGLYENAIVYCFNRGTVFTFVPAICPSQRMLWTNFHRRPSPA